MKGRTTIDELLAATSTRIRRLTPHEALSAQSRGAVLVDTRDSASVAESTPTGAIHIPLSVLPWRADPTAEHPHPSLSDLATPMIVMCQDGYSSVFAVEMLERIGRAEVADVVGGFTAWHEEGMPRHGTEIRGRAESRQ